jgi:hypothetical protein
MNKPYIIITLGPTGSGKTKLIKETISYLGLKKNYVKILIDDLIENNNKYKEKILSIMNDILDKCEKEAKIKNNKCDIISYYINPTEELLKVFEAAYFSVRNEENLNIKNDNILKRAIKNKRNIVFETTGRYIPKWLLSEPYINEDYNVIFSYSITPFDKLINRNINRTIDSIKIFDNDNTKPAPRLPDIEYNRFKKIVYEIKNTLTEIYMNCINIMKYKKNICGDKNINTLLIFDNSESQMKIAFDSNNKRLSRGEFNKLLNMLFSL